MQHPARIRDGHLESARSSDGDDGEGAEVDRHVDRALPRRVVLKGGEGGLQGVGDKEFGGEESEGIEGWKAERKREYSNRSQKEAGSRPQQVRIKKLGCPHCRSEGNC